ncbi:MAG: hypothetical protein ABSA75_06310 [Candidatus Bathyarchaeia archaeon]|jgi:hypothetical protein
MNIQKYVAGVLVGVVCDYVLYVIIQDFVVSTPGWGTTGWALFAAYNVGLGSFIAFGVRSLLKGDKE